MKADRFAITLYLVFALSGFSGLIYESIWSHYLKLFLGHAAYAQILVLAIFMGGMGFGAWLCSKLVHRFKNLLLVYAIVEGIIGLLGLGFHSFFVSLLSFSYESVFPALENPGLVQLYKWLVSAAIILPQSILLGSTFPLMSNGLLRLVAGKSGYSLSMLYFSNSIGAAIGVLSSGFYLIEKAGLPGTILIAGVLNIIVALIVYLMAKTASEEAKPLKESISRISGPKLLLIAAFITGAASFIYEIAWLRMLSMVLGASTHAFELMLSAFIFGLAMGSLWIRNRIELIKKPFIVAGLIQILMGTFALLTLPVYNHTFNLMSFFIDALDITESGYILFNISSHFIVLLVMLPATFCAGMTLPLFTHILITNGYGEKGIGQIYASNTFGAICGVAFVVLIGMPYFGLKGSMLFGSGLDIVLGFVLINTAIQRPLFSYARFAPLVLFSAFFIFIISFVKLDTEKMTAGVFRHGYIFDKDNEVLFYKDGKTASISVTKTKNLLALKTNGKPDAGIAIVSGKYTTADEYTMALLGALPVAHRPRAKTVAAIGMGSGLTTHTLLAWPEFTSVDTVEIESAVIDAAHYFGSRVENIFTDPRSKIHIEDAKTFFSNHSRKYDIVISEPSNPWVSGVSSLFTEEFYAVIKNHINAGGLFVQWIHAYEIDRVLLLSVLKALSLQFEHLKIYAPNHVDLIILASNGNDIGLPQESIFQVESLRKELGLIGITNINDLNIRFLGDKKLYGSYIDSEKNVVNSDYFPILDHQSPRTRFMRMQAEELYNPPQYYLPVMQMYYPWLDHLEKNKVLHTRFMRNENSLLKAQEIVRYMAGDLPQINDKTVQFQADLLIENARVCKPELNEKLWVESIFSIMTKTLSFLQSLENEFLFERIRPNCPEQITQTQSYWLDLFLSLATRDRDHIIQSGSRLIESEPDLAAPEKLYIRSAIMLSLIVNEDYDVALAYWNNYKSDFLQSDTNLSITMAILLAMVEENAAEAPRSLFSK